MHFKLYDEGLTGEGTAVLDTGISYQSILLLEMVGPHLSYSGDIIIHWNVYLCANVRYTVAVRVI